MCEAATPPSTRSFPLLANRRSQGCVRENLELQAPLGASSAAAVCGEVRHRWILAPREGLNHSGNGGGDALFSAVVACFFQVLWFRRKSKAKPEMPPALLATTTAARGGGSGKGAAEGGVVPSGEVCEARMGDEESLASDGGADGEVELSAGEKLRDADARLGKFASSGEGGDGAFDSSRSSSDAEGSLNCGVGVRIPSLSSKSGQSTPSPSRASRDSVAASPVQSLLSASVTDAFFFSLLGVSAHEAHGEASWPCALCAAGGRLAAAAPAGLELRPAGQLAGCGCSDDEGSPTYFEELHLGSEEVALLRKDEASLSAALQEALDAADASGICGRARRLVGLYCQTFKALYSPGEEKPSLRHASRTSSGAPPACPLGRWLR